MAFSLLEIQIHCVTWLLHALCSTSPDFSYSLCVNSICEDSMWYIFPSALRAPDALPALFLWPFSSSCLGNVVLPVLRFLSSLWRLELGLLHLDFSHSVTEQKGESYLNNECHLSAQRWLKTTIHRKKEHACWLDGSKFTYFLCGLGCEHQSSDKGAKPQWALWEWGNYYRDQTSNQCGKNWGVKVWKERSKDQRRKH